MVIRIKSSSIYEVKKKELEKWGFKVNYLWNQDVYILKVPKKIELKHIGLSYLIINTVDGKNLGEIIGNPFTPNSDGAQLLFVP